jgi:group I intron endonuclease
MNKNSYIVYAIVVLVLLKAYVGSTINSERRWKRQHLPALRKNKHSNKPLQGAYNHYGEDILEFICLEVVEEMRALPEREIEWIKDLKAQDAALNNKISGNPGSRGKKLSIETRRKQSLAKRGKNHPDNRKDFAFVSPKGEVHTPHGLKDFCKRFGLSVCGMSRVSKSKQKAHQGWRKRYERQCLCTDRIT